MSARSMLIFMCICWFFVGCASDDAQKKLARRHTSAAQIPQETLSELAQVLSKRPASDPTPVNVPETSGTDGGEFSANRSPTLMRLGTAARVAAVTKKWARKVSSPKPATPPPLPAIPEKFLSTTDLCAYVAEGGDNAEKFYESCKALACNVIQSFQSNTILVPGLSDTACIAHCYKQDFSDIEPAVLELCEKRNSFVEDLLEQEQERGQYQNMFRRFIWYIAWQCACLSTETKIVEIESLYPSDDREAAAIITGYLKGMSFWDKDARNNMVTLPQDPRIFQTYLTFMITGLAREVAAKKNASKASKKRVTWEDSQTGAE